MLVDTVGVGLPAGGHSGHLFRYILGPGTAGPVKRKFHGVPALLTNTRTVGSPTAALKYVHGMFLCDRYGCADMPFVVYFYWRICGAGYVSQDYCWLHRLIFDAMANGANIFHYSAHVNSCLVRQ